MRSLDSHVCLTDVLFRVKGQDVAVIQVADFLPGLEY